MEKLFGFVLKVIEALKPKLYNKLTWLIVVGGLSLMSTPLWLGIVNNLFEAQFQISITDNSDTTWGFALCCLGLSYHLMSTGLHEVAIIINSKNLSQKGFIPNNEATSKMQHGLVVFDFLFPTNKQSTITV